MRASLSGLLLVLAASASAQFALHDGDRVVFYGDSITDNAAYTQLVETFVLTRFPTMNVRFFNAGVGGDRVTGGWMGPIDQRLTRDLFSRKPTVVTVMLGMNDAAYRTFDDGLFGTYQNGYRHMADRFKEEIPSARIWLMQPSPFDDFSRGPNLAGGGYNAVLQKYAGFVADLAKEKRYGLVDQNTPMVDALTKATMADAANAAKMLPDKVHPGFSGHLLMAATLLKAWGAPAMVSKTDIDASTGRSDNVGAVVKNVKTGATVTWSSLEDSLPFPINRQDALTALMLKSSSIEDWLGREVVIVRNLPAGNYDLSIDGVKVGTFSAEIFGSGIDLSWLDTPMLRQAWKVNDLTGKRTALMYNNWRNVEFSLQALDLKTKADAVKGTEKLNEEIIRLQHDEARPREHVFQVSKAAG